MKNAKIIMLFLLLIAIVNFYPVVYAHEEFYNQKDSCQRYNSNPRYESPELWDTNIYKEATWTNACFITDVTSPAETVCAKTLEVKWVCSGRWDMDPSATVSISIQPMNSDGSEKSDPSITLVSGISYNAGSTTVDLSACSGGCYRIVIIKDNDSYTGGKGKMFRFQTLPDLQSTLTSIKLEDRSTADFAMYLITMNVKVENVGALHCGQFKVKWSGSPVLKPEYVRGSNVQMVSLYPETMTETIAKLSAGDFVELSNSWLIDKNYYDNLANGSQRGLFILSCEADEQENIIEADEDNNTAIYSIASSYTGVLLERKPTLDIVLVDNPQINKKIIEVASQDILMELLDIITGTIAERYVTRSSGKTQVWEATPNIVHSIIK